ncbi:crossover junction endodeoxyribonuclease RuvC [Candidatus Gottesmanbacteria bacterium]|nr:crossover junction endodeoxyribonuclease RuvC [Candidatus Gottesmanbacteria bacterium]
MKGVLKSEIILGIDPGFGRIGFALVKEQGQDFKVQEYGCLETPQNTSQYHRLLLIFEKVKGLIKKNKPDVVAMEEIFFGRNVTTAFQVGKAHGVVQLASTQSNIPVVYYTPAHIKISVTGYGHADKTQIQKMVKSILHLREIPKPDDAADALAIALTHSFRRNSNFKLDARR